MEEELTGFIGLIRMDSLEHSRQAGRIADELESFVMFYPETELRRKAMIIVHRLRKISEHAD